MPRRVVDPVKAKEKKQKIFVAVGGGFLFLLLAVLGPSTWSSLNAKPPEQAAETSPTSSAPAPSVAPATSATATGANATPAVLVAETAPTPAAGQLSSFRRFRSKDPFAPQVRERGTGTMMPATGPPHRARLRARDDQRDDVVARAVRHGSPQKRLERAAARRRLKRARAKGQPPAPAAASDEVVLASARISVNGVVMTVAKGGLFPDSNPFFRLVSLSPRSVSVALNDADYATGGEKLKLRLGRRVTLVNTADGTRYVLVFRGAA